MLAAAEEQGTTPLAIAVVDEWGDLMGFARMDSATPFACQNARKKAYSAAILRSDARDQDAAFRAERRSIAELADPGLVSSTGGGVVIRVGAQVVGGIGVSGGSAVENESVARAGLAALQG
jgi:uncharacterized protein GlcG (DUF336 family)